MSDEPKTGGKVVQEILERYAEPQAPRSDRVEAGVPVAPKAPPAVKGTAYGLFKIVPRFSQPKLELRFLTGRKKFLSYSFIDAGDLDGGLIEIEHTRYLVTLKGRNLDPLFEAVRRERAEFVQESDPMKDREGTDATVVYEITVKPPR